MGQARWWDSRSVLRSLEGSEHTVGSGLCLPDPAPQLAETFSQFGCFSRDLF